MIRLSPKIILSLHIFPLYTALHKKASVETKEAVCALSLLLYGVFFGDLMYIKKTENEWRKKRKSY
jgi:hypothetical protein